MTRPSRRRWDELQTRWAAGERLAPEEEQQRLEYAASDELARRELAVFEELRARVGAGAAEPLPPGLLERVLEAARSRPHLRVVSGEHTPSPARPNTRRRLAVLAAAVALPAALLGTLLLYRAPPPAPQLPQASPPQARAAAPARSELVLASGEVRVQDGPARVGGRPLLRGDRIATGAGRACLTIDPGIDVCLSPDSEVSLESLDPTKIRVRVGRGSALAQLTRRAPDSTFALTAGAVSAEARGTLFAVQHAAGGDGVDVIVVEGVVSVAHDRRAPVLVQAHSRLSLRGSSVERASVGRSEEARLWALAAPRELWSEPQIGVLEIPVFEAGASATIDEQPPLALPLRVFVPAGKRRVALETSSGKELAALVDVSAGAVRELGPGDFPSEAAAEESSVPSAAVLLGAARRELALGNSRAALALYDRLRTAYPASPEARTVLVTVGKLQLDLEQPARALGSFEAYLKTGGPLAPEALAGKVVALRALGRKQEERRAIELYLERHPNGFDAPLFQKRLSALQSP